MAARTRGKVTLPPTLTGATQLTLEQALEQQPNQPVEWEFEAEDIGGELLGIISKGLYPDPLDCIREYVQNSVDGKAKDVTIKITGNSVIIKDDGLGMAVEDLKQARQLGISYKSPAENVGFRGIGVYSAFGICNRLVITTKKAGESKSRILEWRFGEMKELLQTERATQAPRTSLARLISKYSHFRQENEEIDRHFTMVLLEEVSNDHIGQLADYERLRDYLLHNLPIDFAEQFPYKDQINSQLENHVPGYNAIRVKLITDFARPEIIVKPNIPNLSEPSLGFITTTDGKQVAYYWACYHKNGGLIPEEYKSHRGLVYKVKGFTIGDRESLREYFPTASGTLYQWCTGEIYVIDDKVIPNAARNDFEVSPEKLQLETAVGYTLRKLNAKVDGFRQRINADKEFEKARNYLAEVENGIASYHPEQCKKKHDELVKNLLSLSNKKNKTKLDSAIVQEVIQRMETLRDRLRQMIDQPDKSATQPVPSRPTSANATSPTPRPLLSATKPISASSTSSSVSLPGAVSPKLPAQDVSLPENPMRNPVPSETLEQKVVTPSLSTKTLQQIFEQSGFDIDGNCLQLLQVLERSLTSVLPREMYERVLGDLEVQLEYEVTEEIESEDE